MWRFIAVTIFVLGEALYNKFCPSVNIAFEGQGVGITNWSIFYFCCTYTTMIIICVEGIIREFSSYFRIGLFVYLFFFVFLLIIDLSKINMSYNDYLHSVGDRFPNMILHLFLTLSVSFIAIELWYEFIKVKLCQLIKSKFGHSF